MILSSDEAPLLEHSLAAAVGEQFDEGLVIDNSSSDATAALASRHGVPRLRLDRRLPYTEAMNAGLRSVEGDAIAMLKEFPGRTRSIHAVPFGHRGVQRLFRDGLGFRIRTGDRDHFVPGLAPFLEKGWTAALVPIALPSEVLASLGLYSFLITDTIHPYLPLRLADLVHPGVPLMGILHRLFGWRAWYAPDAVVHHIRRYSPSTRTGMSAADRRTQFRNRYLMIVKNDSPSDLLRDLGPLLLYELLAAGYALLRERELLGGYREAAARLPEARKRRRVVQARRRVRRVPFGMQPPSD